MTDHGQSYDYLASAALQIKDGNVEDYVRAADFLNAGRFDTVCLQHDRPERWSTASSRGARFRCEPIRFC
jgi:hypothetical protein